MCIFQDFQNWNPKREVLLFFDPEKYKHLQFKNELVTNQERNRIFRSEIKRNERQFEPEKFNQVLIKIIIKKI